MLFIICERKTKLRNYWYCISSYKQKTHMIIFVLENNNFQKWLPNINMFHVTFICALKKVCNVLNPYLVNVRICHEIKQMYISGIIFFFPMHFMCIFIYVGLLYCSVFISYTFLYAPFSFFHITSNTVYIKHSGRNFISVCQVIYLFFVDLHVCVHLLVHFTSLMFESRDKCHTGVI